jgi:hypothetical protein
VIRQRLVAFAEDLRQELLIDAEVEGAEMLLPEAFTRRMIETVIEVGELEEAVAAHHRDRGIEVAGYGVEDEDTLNLIACDYRGEVPPGSATRTDISTAMRRLDGMWERCRDRPYHEQLEESSDAYGMARHIHLVASGIRRIRMVLVTDALAAVEYIEPEERDGLEIRRSIWDIARLFRLETSGHGREAISIDFTERHGPLPCLPAGSVDADYSAYLAAIPGRVLADIYEEYGARLLELNVRSFLQATNKVNRGIRDTLTREPDRFLAYNNGISATASEVELVGLPDGGHGISIIRDLQIVNGGQTTASVHRLRGLEQLDHVLVQAKITVIPPERLDDVVPLISRYANSQNKVQEADLSANHPWHVELESLSRTVWAPATGDTMRQTRWFYERARGSYRDAESREGSTARRRAWRQAHPARQKMTKTDVAAYENLWDQLPHIVTRGAQKNFTEFMSRLARRGNPLPDIGTFQHLVAKAILVHRTRQVVTAQAFGGYRANVVAYAVAKLSNATGKRLDLDAIWRTQAVPEPVEVALVELAHIAHRIVVQGAPSGANITEWSKRDECWTLVREEQWSLSPDLEELLVVSASGNVRRGNRDTQAVVRRMSDLGADFWTTLAGWVKETDNLTPLQRQFAESIAGQLRRGRDLTVKQALYAEQILNAATNNGLSVDVTASTPPPDLTATLTGAHGTPAPSSPAGTRRRSVWDRAAELAGRQARARGDRPLGQALGQVEDLLDRMRDRPPNPAPVSPQPPPEDIPSSVSDRPSGRLQQYTDETLMDAIRDVAEQLGHTPSSVEYKEVASRQGLPSLPTIGQRLGGWTAAVAAAGLTPSRVQRSSARRWDEAACRTALERLVGEIGGVPTAAHYKALAQQRDDLPSPATLGFRLGPWNEIAAKLNGAMSNDVGGASTID